LRVDATQHAHHRAKDSQRPSVAMRAGPNAAATTGTAPTPVRLR
jgi:hypothetical protein